MAWSYKVGSSIPTNSVRIRPLALPHLSIVPDAPSVARAVFPVSVRDLHDAGDTAGIGIIAAIAHEAS